MKNNAAKVLALLLLISGCLLGAGYLIIAGHPSETWGWFVFIGFIGVIGLLNE